MGQGDVALPGSVPTMRRSAGRSLRNSDWWPPASGRGHTMSTARRWKWNWRRCDGMWRRLRSAALTPLRGWRCCYSLVAIGRQLARRRDAMMTMVMLVVLLLLQCWWIQGVSTYFHVCTHTHTLRTRLGRGRKRHSATVGAAECQGLSNRGINPTAR